MSILYSNKFINPQQFPVLTLKPLYPSATTGLRSRSFFCQKQQQQQQSQESLTDFMQTVLILSTEVLLLCACKAFCLWVKEQRTDKEITFSLENKELPYPQVFLLLGQWSPKGWRSQRPPAELKQAWHLPATASWKPSCTAFKAGTLFLRQVVLCGGEKKKSMIKKKKISLW